MISATQISGNSIIDIEKALTLRKEARALSKKLLDDLALPIIQESLKLNPNDPLSHIVYANCIMGIERDYEAAIKEFKLAAKLCNEKVNYREPEKGFNTHWAACRNIGYTYQYNLAPNAIDEKDKISFLKESIKYYKQAIEIDSSYSRAHLDLAGVFSELYYMTPSSDISARTSYLKHSARHYEDAIKINPKDFELHLELARIYVRLSSNLDDEYALQALRSFERAQQLNEEDYSTNFELADFIDTILRKDNKIPVFFDSDSQQKGKPLFWKPFEEVINLARICYNKSIDVAQSWPDNEESKDSTLFSCYYGLGSFLYNIIKTHFNYLSKKYSYNDLEAIKQDAEKYFKQAQKLAKPESYDASIAFHSLGILYEYKGGYKTALAEYEKALKIEPEDPLYLCDALDVQIKLKYYEEARKNFRLLDRIITEINKTGIWPKNFVDVHIERIKSTALKAQEIFASDEEQKDSGQTTVESLLEQIKFLQKQQDQQEQKRRKYSAEMKSQKAKLHIIQNKHDELETKNAEYESELRKHQEILDISGITALTKITKEFDSIKDSDTELYNYANYLRWSILKIIKSGDTDQAEQDQEFSMKSALAKGAEIGIHVAASAVPFAKGFVDVIERMITNVSEMRKERIASNKSAAMEMLVQVKCDHETDLFNKISQAALACAYQMESNIKYLSLHSKTEDKNIFGIVKDKWQKIENKLLEPFSAIEKPPGAKLASQHLPIIILYMLTNIKDILQEKQLTFEKIFINALEEKNVESFANQLAQTIDNIIGFTDHASPELKDHESFQGVVLDAAPTDNAHKEDNSDLTGQPPPESSCCIIL